MGLKKKLKKSVKKVSKVATAAKPANLKKFGNKTFNAVKEAAAPLAKVADSVKPLAEAALPLAVPIAASVLTGGVSAAAGLATTMLANQVQQYVPLQEDYFPAQEDYTSVYEDYASNYASQFSLSSNLSPLERELFYRQSYNNALKSSPSFKEEGGFLGTLLKILFG